MASAAYNLVVHKGADFSTGIKIKTDGSVVNLTGYGYTCVMRKHYESNVGYAFSTTTLAPATLGVVKLEMHHTVTSYLPTGRHVFDLIIINPEGGYEKVLEGNVLVTGSTSNDRG